MVSFSSFQNYYIVFRTVFDFFEHTLHIFSRKSLHQVLHFCLLFLIIWQISINCTLRIDKVSKISKIMLKLLKTFTRGIITKYNKWFN